MEEETFHYTKVAEFSFQKPHSLRAYCSVKKIPSAAMPKSKVLEFLEGRIIRLEKEAKNNIAKIPTLGLVKKNYRRLKGYHIDEDEEVEKVPSLEEIKETKEKEEFEKQYSELEKKTIPVEEKKPVKNFSEENIIVSEVKEEEKKLDTPVYDRLKKYFNISSNKLTLDKMSDLILKEINRYKRKLSPYETNEDLDKLRILFNSLYGIFIERKLKRKIKPCVPLAI